MKDKIRAILVDDVELMRLTLKKVLEQFPHIELIGEASDFDSAKELINTVKPDLVFLDIDLNGLTSIDLLSQVTHLPKIIFITSHPDFAIKAFELNAIDYILKPISTERIRKAIERLTNDDTAPKQVENEAINPLTDNNERFEADQIILLSFDNKLFFSRF